MRSIILQTIFFFAVATTICNAQVTLRNFENLRPGSSAKYLTANESNVYAGRSGEHVTWTFSNLTLKNDTLEQRTILPSQAPNASQFPTANIVQEGSDGTYIYINQKPDTTYVVGVTDPDLGIMIKYTDPYTYISRPFTYNDRITDYHARNYTFNGVDLRGGGTSSSTADGHGSLIVNGKVYDNVLRINYLQETNDTSINDGLVINVKTFSTIWYDSLHVFPLFRIDSISITSPVFNESIKEVYVLHEELNTNISTAKNASQKPKVFIQNEQLVIDNKSVILQEMNLQLVNVSGQVVLNEKLNSVNTISNISLQEKNIKPGIYFVNMIYKENGVLKTNTVKVLKN